MSTMYHTCTQHFWSGPVYTQCPKCVLAAEVPVGFKKPIGQKFDGDKDEPSLLMQGCNLAVAGVIAVLGFGFKKYGKRSGWKEVPEAPRRYKDALYRHLAAIERGEMVDPESGKPHWDHVACNAMFESQMYHEQESEIAKVPS